MRKETYLYIKTKNLYIFSILWQKQQKPEQKYYKLLDLISSNEQQELSSKPSLDSRRTHALDNIKYRS